MFVLVSFLMFWCKLNEKQWKRKIIAPEKSSFPFIV